VNPRLLIVTAAAAVAVALSGCAVLDAANEHDETSYTVDGSVTALTVRDPSGRVEVVTGTGQVAVREQYTYSSDRPKTSHKVAGGTLSLVNDGCDQKGLVRRCQVDYRIEVPAGTTVTVDADAGEVSVDGITAAVSVDADAGKVVLMDVTGTIKVTAGAGSVRGTGLAGATTVDSDAGSVDLTYATAPSSVNVVSDAGSVRIGLPEGTYAVDAKVSAGSREVEVPTDPNSPNKITVRSSAGSVEIVRA
jgi:DUF4097 and DUF4098 domain-containing protein YvlB